MAKANGTLQLSNYIILIIEAHILVTFIVVDEWYKIYLICKNTNMTKVNDAKYKDRMEGILHTFAPLNYVLKIFSINCQRKKYKSKYCEIARSALPAIILASINSYTLYYKMTYINTSILLSVRCTDAVQMIYDVFQYTVDLVFVYKYGSNLCFEYIKQYAYIDGILGTGFYGSIRRGLIKVMAFLIIMWFSSNLFDYIIWVNGFGLVRTTVYSIAYVYIFIKILTNIDLTVNVMHVETRLRVLGDIVQECCCSAPNCAGMIEDFIGKKDWFYYDERSERSAGSPKFRPMSIIPSINKQEVKWLCRCYLLLTEQVKFINKMFGMRILLNSLSILIDIIRFTNLAVLVLIGAQHTGYESGHFPAIATFWRTLTCITVLLSLVDHCERAYRQRERILCLLDHLIIDKNLDVKLITAFNEFRSLVQSRPISFHMANFIRLEYPLLVSIASLVVTYTIILLQNF